MALELRDGAGRERVSLLGDSRDGNEMMCPHIKFLPILWKTLKRPKETSDRNGNAWFLAFIHSMFGG